MTTHNPIWSADIFYIAARIPGRTLCCPQCGSKGQENVRFGKHSIEVSGYTSRAHCTACLHEETGNEAEALYIHWTIAQIEHQVVTLKAIA